MSHNALHLLKLLVISLLKRLSGSVRCERPYTLGLNWVTLIFWRKKNSELVTETLKKALMALNLRLMLDR